MDSIKIKGLEIQTIIGTLAWERKVKQKLIVDLEVEHDISAAAEHDELEKTVNYAAVAEEVTCFITSNQFQLIETVAEKTAQLIKNGFNVQRLRITVRKPGAISCAKEVAVSIER